LRNYAASWNLPAATIVKFSFSRRISHVAQPIVFGWLAAVFCLAPLTAAMAKDKASGWDKFEAGFKSPFKK